MEQIFGHPSNDQKETPLLDISNITGLLILGLIAIFILMFIGYQKKHSPKTSGTILSSTLAQASNQTFESIESTVTFAPTNTDSAVTTKVVTQNAGLSNIQPSNPKEFSAIYQALFQEFQDDLPSWIAEIDPTSLTIRFDHPDSFFGVGQSSLSQHLKFILANFFPRYVNQLVTHQTAIVALSIEGHTSSEWRHRVSADQAYLNNMTLSQARTRAVLAYCLQLPSIKPYKEWLQNILTANGFANSRSIKENGIEKFEYSRRVEFRILLR